MFCAQLDCTSVWGHRESGAEVWEIPELGNRRWLFCFLLFCLIWSWESVLTGQVTSVIKKYVKNIEDKKYLWDLVTDVWPTQASLFTLSAETSCAFCFVPIFRCTAHWPLICGHFLPPKLPHFVTSFPGALTNGPISMQMDHSTKTKHIHISELLTFQCWTQSRASSKTFTKSLAF